MKECETLAHTYADLIKVTNYINLLVFSIPFDKATSAYVRPIYYVAINCFYLSMVISFLSIVSNMVNNPWIMSVSGKTALLLLIMESPM